MIDKGQLTGGTIEVDMNTIEDEKHGSKNNLIDHLKSADFFETEKFPFSTFAITMVAPVNDSTINVTGILTMKNISHTVTFPARIEVKDGVANASGKLSVDRTQWNVVYQSEKFGGGLADNLISDTITFDVKIVARK
jgi:polyisoprenoid-binding protein YceI